MIEFFVRRPVTTIMFVSVFMVLGVVAYFNLNIEETPKIDFPIVTVETLYPGATPFEVETQIVNKIEDEIAEISEIKKINSNSYNGLGYIQIEFLLSADVNVKSIEVKDKVEGILNDLPDGAEKPIIKKFDPLLKPVINLVLMSQTLSERDLYEYADKTFKDELSRIQGVASVDIFGGHERRINIKVDPLLMQQHYISIDAVAKRISAQNRNIPGGDIDRENNSLSVRFQGEFTTVDDIKNLILISGDGVPFRLKDIAQVEDGYKKVDTMARFNGKAVVTLSVKKVSDGNAVNITKEVHKRLPEFKRALPEGIELAVAVDTTKFIINETKDAQISILIGILLTAVILFLFTGFIKLTLISSIVIPTSVLSTWFLMDAYEFSLNMLTLLAIATALGTLVANAIVIIEHILERMQEGDSSVDAAINGTKRCAAAVLASAGTNLVVFTPIAFMGGMVGQFMKSFGLTVVFATIFSLIASFSLTPMLCAYLLKNLNIKKSYTWGENPFFLLVRITNMGVDFCRKEYLHLLRGMFRFPKSTLILVFLALWSLKFILPFVGNEFYPSSDQDKINIAITMPQGTTIERTSEVVNVIEKRIAQVSEVESMLSLIGENGVENAFITVNLFPLKKRDRSDIAIINELIPFTATLPDVEVEYSQSSAGPKGADIEIHVYGVDYDEMIALSRKMKGVMEKSGYFRSVSSSYKYPKTEIQFIPDQEKMTEYGVDNKLLGEILRTSIYGDDSNIFKENGEEYDINIEVDTKYKNNFLDIHEINVISRKGLIPITELGSVVRKKAIPTIKHRDKRRVILLSGYLSKATAGYVQALLEKEFVQLPWDKGCGFNFVGKSEDSAEAGQEISKAFLIAMILTFMLLAAILNSFTYPISIISTVVTSFVGVFLLLFFTDKSINVASMLGMVMLVGLVVNGAILMIEYAVHRMEEGVEIKEAIFQAADHKFRAIVMTALAIVAGTVPQMWSVVPLKNSMAVVIIGGMIAATFFTFVCVPVLFWYFERMRRFFLRSK